jgi:hypothetical protein
MSDKGPGSGDTRPSIGYAEDREEMQVTNKDCSGSKQKQFRFNETQIRVLIQSIDIVGWAALPDGNGERNASIILRRQLQDALDLIVKEE